MAMSVQQGASNTYTESTCVAACVASSTCMAVDWGIASELCWFETAQNHLLFNMIGVDHYDLFYPDYCIDTTGIARPIQFCN